MLGACGGETAGPTSRLGLSGHPRGWLVLRPAASLCAPTGNRVLVHFPPRADRPLGGDVLPGVFGAHPPGEIPQQPSTFQLPGKSVWTPS